MTPKEKCDELLSKFSKTKAIEIAKTKMGIAEYEAVEKNDYKVVYFWKEVIQQIDKQIL